MTSQYLGQGIISTPSQSSFWVRISLQSDKPKSMVLKRRGSSRQIDQPTQATIKEPESWLIAVEKSSLHTNTTSCLGHSGLSLQFEQYNTLGRITSPISLLAALKRSSKSSAPEGHYSIRSPRTQGWCQLVQAGRKRRALESL